MVACGGAAPERNDSAIATLCWGFIDPASSATDVGRVLDEARRADLATQESIERVNAGFLAHDRIPESP
jgi:hypothetical protein